MISILTTKTKVKSKFDLQKNQFLLFEIVTGIIYIKKLVNIFMKILCNYYVTLRCNLKCKFCNIWQQKENFNLPEQNINEIENNLKALKKLGVKLIDFTGGEPLLYQNLIAALKLAKKYGFFTTVTTNGMLYPKYAAELKGLVDFQYISIQSVNAEIHNNITGTKCFDAVIKSIEVAKKVKQKISLLHTVTDESINNIWELIRFAQSNKCALRCNPCFTYFGNDQFTPKLIPELKKIFKEPYVTLDLALLRFITDGGNKIEKPLCSAINSTVVISPDNYLILPCYHHALKKIKIQNNLYELHELPEVKNIAKSVGRFDFCNGCKINCYMRVCLFKKYSFLSLKSWANSLVEMSRKQF